MLYPLTFSQNGNLEIANTKVQKDISQITHLVNTISGERELSPDFGIPIDILYSSGIPDLLTERVRIAIRQLQDIKSEVRIDKYERGTLKLVVEFGESIIATTIK